MFEINIMLKQG